MLRTKANPREQPALPRCLMLLVVLATMLAVTATTFGATNTTSAGAVAPLDDNALEALAAPVALYPDELLAIVLPAATFPLQIVQAARFLEARKHNPGLEPDEAWDDSVVALLNYPEVLALLDSDLAWTARLGDAVIAQEAPLMSAITRFRERAYAAGNLRSDERQRVSRGADAIAINTASTDTVYVPYYQPSAVIVPQVAPAYHYYSNPYPLYYYPYTQQHPYLSRPFWGLTTAYTLGWAARGIRIYRHDHHAHPYFRKRYYAPRYRDRRSVSPRHAPYAHHGDRRNGSGDAWRRGRVDGHHTERRRHASDRIRHSHEAGRTGVGNGFRANNGLLGNGALARPQNRTQSRGLTRADRGLGAQGAGANSRRDGVALTPRVKPRQQDVTPPRRRVYDAIKQRDNPPSRQARNAREHSSAATRQRSGQRDSRHAQSARGSANRAQARTNPGGPGRAYRDPRAGKRARTGGGFLGNGFGTTRQRR